MIPGSALSRVLLIGLCAAPLVAGAGPWAAPGDATLRHDVTLLADRGIVRGPIQMWPLSWGDLAKDVLAAQDGHSNDPSVQASLLRVQRAVRRAMRTGEVHLNARAAGAAEPTPLRTFTDVPREDGELEAGIDWTGSRFALRLQATAVADADDDKDLRADGSYVGVNIGNFMVSAGLMDRWWGPGWEGSLILSNSTRPIPALTIERNYSDPFPWRWLRWIGPWRANVSFGQLEGHRTDFDDARFFAARVSFKPLQQLEIGLSRTAQWCGEGRPCGFGTLSDLLIGRDNDQPLGQQPGNQLAGYDARWAFRSFPLAVYGQMIGEDEAGFLPSKFLGLAGIEGWGANRWGSWRAHIEYADTSCNFSRSNPAFDCAYESSVYTQGYRYRGRSIGHAMDGDGRMTSAGVLFVDSHDARWELLVRRVELNRDAVSVPEPGHTLAPVAEKLDNIELSHARAFGDGELRVGVGYDDFKERRDGGDDNMLRGYLEWQRQF